MNYLSRAGRQLLIGIMEFNNLPFNPSSVDLKLNINGNTISLTGDIKSNINKVFSETRIMSTISFELCFPNSNLNTILNPIEHLNPSLLESISDVINLKLFDIKINQNCIVDSLSFEKLVNSKLTLSKPITTDYYKLNSSIHPRTFKHKSRIYRDNISIVN